MKSVLLFVTLFSQSLFASSLSDLSFLYYKNHLSSQEKSLSISNPGECHPGQRPVSCMRAVCEKLDADECDDNHEIQKVVEMCKGNVNGECFQSATRRLEKSDIDDMYEAQKVAVACREIQGSSCIDLFINKLDTNDVDDDYEVLKIIPQCKGVSDEVADCAAFSCSKMSASNCDDDYEIVKVLKSCGN